MTFVRLVVTVTECEWNFAAIKSLFFSSSTSNGTEFTVPGVMILVTMSINYTGGTAGLASSFSLRFLRTRNDTILPPKRTLYPTNFVTEEGQRIAPFPENNAVNYTNNANHFMVISRPSGRCFNLTQTFHDTQAIFDFYRGYRVEDNAEKTWFNYQWE